MLDGYFMYDAVRRCTATQFATMRAIGAVRWRAVGVEIGHYGAVRFGLDGRTVATGWSRWFWPLCWAAGRALGWRLGWRAGGASGSGGSAGSDGGTGAAATEYCADKEAARSSRQVRAPEASGDR